MKIFCKFSCICFQGFPVFNSSLLHTTLALSTFYLVNTTGWVYGCVMSSCLSSKKFKICQWRRAHRQGQRENHTWSTQCDDCTPTRKKCTQKKRKKLPLWPKHQTNPLGNVLFLLITTCLLVRDTVGQRYLSHCISYENEGAHSL